MSRRGNCYDNAPMESFWGSMKNELVHHRHYETRLMAEASIREYIGFFIIVKGCTRALAIWRLLFLYKISENNRPVLEVGVSTIVSTGHFT